MDFKIDTRVSAVPCHALLRQGLPWRQPLRARQCRPASLLHVVLTRLQGCEEMKEGSRGFTNPENSQDFFKKQPTHMKAKRGKLRGK
jgi:hypothetical protein